MKTKVGGILYRVTAPNFSALYQLNAGNTHIWWAAPIIAHMDRWSQDKARDYCWAKGWKLDRREEAFEKGKLLEWWTEEVRPSA